MTAPPDGRPAAVPWLPLEFTNVDYIDVEPTAALAGLAPDANSTNMDHDNWHNIWTGPPGFSGLDVLAVTPEVLDADRGPSVAILGGAQTILGESTPTPAPSYTIADSLGCDGNARADAHRARGPAAPRHRWNAVWRGLQRPALAGGHRWRNRPHRQRQRLVRLPEKARPLA